MGKLTINCSDSRWKEIVENGRPEILNADIDVDSLKMQVVMIIHVEEGDNKGVWLVGEYNGEEFWMSCSMSEYDFLIENEPPLTKAVATPVTTFVYKIDESL